MAHLFLRRCSTHFSMWKRRICIAKNASPTRRQVHSSQPSVTAIAHLVPEPEQGDAWPLDWSSDGRFIVYATGDIVGRIQTDLWVLPLESGEPVPFAVTPANELGAQFSPNGKWMAYASDESGRFEGLCCAVRSARRSNDPDRGR